MTKQQQSDLVTRAILDAGDGQRGVRVRIADVRDRLTGRVRSDDVAVVLVSLAISARVLLVKLDALDVTDRDRAATIYTPSGQPRDAVYLLP